MAHEKGLHVAVIGGGLAGLALTLQLKKLHGISCTVYERQAGVEERGVNIALAPNAVRVLQHIGVYHPLRAQGCTYEKRAVSNARGQELGSLLHGSEKHYNYSARRVHRATVQKALLDEATTQGIAVNFDMKLTGLAEDATDVTLTFANRHTTAADVVVVYSTVRRHVVPGCELAYSGFIGIIAMHVNRHQLRGESAKTTYFPNFCYGQTSFVAMMPASVDGTDLDFFSTMPAPARSRSEWDEPAQDPDALREIIRARFGTGWPEHVMGVAQEWPKEGFTLYP